MLNVSAIEFDGQLWYKERIGRTYVATRQSFYLVRMLQSFRVLLCWCCLEKGE